MKHTYSLTGMTCSSCEQKVGDLLSGVQGIRVVEISKERNTASLEMHNHIETAVLQQALGGPQSKYQISGGQMPAADEPKTGLAVYKPVFLIFGYILAVTMLLQLTADRFDGMQMMRQFMAGFFLVFSFFKMLDLKAFAESYVMYDVIARKIPAWAYVYAFVELGLGFAFLVNFEPLFTNIATFAVMGVSIVGVLQSVLNKRKIRCACLGAVFNLPMSTVTIIEDALMLLMSAAMIVSLLT